MNEKKEALRIEILKYLEKHSRINLSELAVLMGAEEAEVANEVAEMEKEKIICGYHTLIDWDKTGVEMVSALIVRPNRGTAVQLSGSLCGIPDFGKLRSARDAGRKDIKGSVSVCI